MCASCKHIRFTYSTFSSISVQVHENNLQIHSLEKLVDESFAQKETEGYLCGECGAQTRLITLDHILDFPPLLFVYVNRF